VLPHADARGHDRQPQRIGYMNASLLRCVTAVPMPSAPGPVRWTDRHSEEFHGRQWEEQAQYVAVEGVDRGLRGRAISSHTGVA
jgi:hypothetical protein